MAGEPGTTYRSALQEAATKAGVGADAEAVETGSEAKGKSSEETRSKHSGDSTGKSKEATPYHPLLSDMELDDLSEEVKSKVLEKVKKYDRAFQKEQTGYQTFKKFQSMYQTNAAFAEEVDKVVSKHTGNGRQEERGERDSERKSDSTTAASKHLDALLREAKTAEEREAIRESRQIIAEETQEYRETITRLEQELKALKQDLIGFRSERQASRLSGFAKELDDLETKYSQSLIEKYRDDLTSWAAKYPSKDARWLLYKVADPEEIEEARLTPKKPAEQGRKGSNSSNTRRPAASVTTNATEELDERFKTGSGKAQRWNLGSAFKHLASQKSSAR